MFLTDLSLIFGVLESKVSKYIDFIRGIIQSLRLRLELRIKWPSLEEMRRWAALVDERKPDIKTVVLFVDGLILAIQCNEEISVQNFDLG